MGENHLCDLCVASSTRATAPGEPPVDSCTLESTTKVRASALETPLLHKAQDSVEFRLSSLYLSYFVSKTNNKVFQTKSTDKATPYLMPLAFLFIRYPLRERERKEIDLVNVNFVTYSVTVLQAITL